MADIFYRVEKRLIILPVILWSPTHFFKAQFVLDTGASHTIIDYRIAEALGYSQKDAHGRSKVSSAAGGEEGYRLRLETLKALGKELSPFDVACHALFEQGVEGLLGMTFLERFNFCIFSIKATHQNRIALYFLFHLVSLQCAFVIQRGCRGSDIQASKHSKIYRSAGGGRSRRASAQGGDGSAFGKQSAAVGICHHR